MNNSTALDLTGGTSPFDTIRRTRPDGSEYWSARELMPLLGYDSYRRLADAIDRAKAAAQAQGLDVTNLFADAVKKSSGGRPADDVHLTRFAAYLVVMNGDPRKPQIAAGQSYFAIKTREAETAPSLPSDPFELIIFQARAMQAVQRTADEAKAIASKTDARLDALEGRHDWFAALGYARLNGHPTSAKYLSRVGSKASLIAKPQGIQPITLPHPMYGTQNSYPAWVWELAFAEVARND